MTPDDHARGTGPRPESAGESSYLNGNRPRIPEDVIRRAVIDVLRLRTELNRHDVSPGLRDGMLTAAMPAFLTAEFNEHMSEQAWTNSCGEPEEQWR